VPRLGAKDTVDGTTNLDVLYFQRHGLFSYTPGWPYQLTWRRGDDVVSSIGWTLVGLRARPPQYD